MATRRENGAGTEPKQDVNGRWWIKVSYHDAETAELKRTTIRGASQGEVLAKKKDLVKKSEAGVNPTNNKVTFQEWLYTWLEVNKKGSVANRTYTIYKTIIDCHVKDTKLGKMALDKIRRVDLQKYMNEKGEQVAPRYLSTIKIVISDAFNVAELDCMIIRNPCKKLKLPSIVKEEIKPLNNDEIKLLLDTAGAGSLMYNIIFLALHTGMRRGEICGLKWADVNLSKKQISVKQQAKVDRMDGVKLELGTLKTKSAYRTMPMDGRLIEVLKWHQAQQKKIKKSLGDGYNDLDLVFSGPAGNIITPNTVGTRFDRLVSKSGVPKRTFHQLRHTFASVAISQGMNIKAVSAILGHEKTSTTLDIYGHLLPGDAEMVVNAVAAFYGV